MNCSQMKTSVTTAIDAAEWLGPTWARPRDGGRDDAGDHAVVDTASSGMVGDLFPQEYWDLLAAAPANQLKCRGSGIALTLCCRIRSGS